MECELGRELFEAHKDLAKKVMTHSFLLHAVLSVSDRDALNRVKDILEGLAATDEFRELAVASLHDALQIVSLFSGSDDHPVDPHKLFRLIPGGKKEKSG